MFHGASRERRLCASEVPGYIGPTALGAIAVGTTGWPNASDGP